MKIKISDIVKTDGASIDIDFNETVDNLDAVADEFEFEAPVSFKGQLTNSGGVLMLTGRLKSEYRTRCFRCLKEIIGQVDINIKENFVSKENTAEEEAYTYEGNFLELDKVLKDNIILYLPMRQLCTKECKGICSKCGSNLNEKLCDCTEEVVDSRLEVLKNFFEK